MMVTGVAMFLTAPIAGRLVQSVDLRLVMGVGFALFALSAWMMTGLTDDWDYWEIFLPQVLRGSRSCCAWCRFRISRWGCCRPSRSRTPRGCST
ncbi:hypothetical protein QWZ10_24905 [Paracoccus cavernae]|uniref:Major facilitator superfamily (MFS) profile domain-containing protein n=1 Tax=Paracoccus cavernae TaxID=1571207 RepID=A0ABT8DC14_9RHOB|nr:hypothetical protein [Paracoccus cavernae]MDN3714230.1 hypothetical protein [Paracoccus cavernae]